MLEGLYKALDEVSLLFRIERQLYQEANLWYVVMQVVKLAECEIYSYNPNSDADPFLERGAM